MVSTISLMTKESIYRGTEGKKEGMRRKRKREKGRRERREDAQQSRTPRMPFSLIRKPGPPE